jgi:cyclic pyranopterin phosphate synthase
MPRGHVLAYDEILEIAQAAARLGIGKFRITGGEPLLRSNLIQFIRSLSKTQGVQKISLTTNGILLKRFAKKLRDAGVHTLNVSLDSLDARKFSQITRGGNLPDVWEGVEEAMRSGFTSVKLNVLLMRNINDMEILDFARLTMLYPLQIRFIEFMPYGEWENGCDEVFLPAMEVAERIKMLGKVMPADVPNGGPAKYFKIKGAQGTIGLITPVSQPFCGDCNRLRLTADGKLRSCLLSTEQVDVLKTLRGERTPNDVANVLKKAVLLKPQMHAARRNVIMSTIGG